MTIIVGIEYDGGILIAADSQATGYRGAAVKRVAAKIRDFEATVNGVTTRIVMAGSGSDPYISRAAEIITRGHQAVFGSPREVAEYVEDAVTEIHKRYIVDRAKKLGSAAESQIDLALMLAAACAPSQHDKRSLFIIYPQGVAEREDGYATIGSGAPYAEYILSRVYRRNMPLDLALKTAVYVIEEVKKIDPYCGGQTRVAVITDSGIQRYDDARINKLAADLAMQDVQQKLVWRLMAGDPDAVAELQRNAQAIQQAQQKIEVPQPAPPERKEVEQAEQRAKESAAPAAERREDKHKVEKIH